MTNITVPLSEEHATRLRELASRLGVSPEELVRLSVEELVGQAGKDFERAAAHVLGKNAELYRRLV